MDDWEPKGCNDCDELDCEHNRDGQCIDKQSMDNPYRQTGCIKHERP